MECNEIVQRGGQQKSTPICRQRPEFKSITNSIPSNLESCGNENRKRIVGGQDTQANSWPWIVFLEFYETVQDDVKYELSLIHI